VKLASHEASTKLKSKIGAIYGTTSFRQRGDEPTTVTGRAARKDKHLFHSKPRAINSRRYAERIPANIPGYLKTWLSTRRKCFLQKRYLMCLRRFALLLSLMLMLILVGCSYPRHVCHPHNRVFSSALLRTAFVIRTPV